MKQPSLLKAKIFMIVLGVSMVMTARAGGLADTVSGDFEKVRIVRTEDTSFWLGVWRMLAYVCLVLYAILGIALVYFIIKMVKARNVSNFELEDHAKKIIRLIVIFTAINTVVFLLSFFLVRAI